MTVEKLEATFEKYMDDEFLKFNLIKKPRHRRADLCGFLMLDDAVPVKSAGHYMICGAEHDEIYLDTDVEELAKVATDSMVRDLVRCGVRFNDGHLEMFA